MAAKPLRGIHVFWWISGFFAVTIALDSLFVVWAIQSFPGEQVKNSYVLGLDFNREVARRKAQEAVGWSAEIGVREEPTRTLVIRVKSAEAGAVTGLQMSASVHIAGEARAQTLTLAEQLPGEYVAPVDLPSEKRIDIEAKAVRQNSDIIFEAAKRLELS
ncbi:MAG TPA: FixH family protein [Hyphomonadaceae bacterium]|jgi:nitrogen fixation protein FixH|nr:FixH family protein [Hyphomonadaceae bacterium]HPN04269.1 FixH family protein [Hyphomonadaceae bacterium]